MLQPALDTRNSWGFWVYLVAVKELNLRDHDMGILHLHYRGAYKKAQRKLESGKVYAHVCIYIYIYMYTYRHRERERERERERKRERERVPDRRRCSHAYLHTCMHACIHTYIHACLHLHTYTIVHVNIYLYIYIHHSP